MIKRAIELSRAARRAKDANNSWRYIGLMDAYYRRLKVAGRA